MTLEDKILFGLEQVAQTLQILLDRESRALSLSALQMRILQSLSTQPFPHGVVSLARRLGVTAATISDAVRVLDEKKLLTKKKAAEDGRAQVLVLTPHGEKIALTGGKIGEAVRKKIALLPEEEQQAFFQTLSNLIGRLLEGGLMPVDRMCSDCHYFHPDFFPDSNAPHLCAFVGTRFEGIHQTTCISSRSRKSSTPGRQRMGLRR